jgi:spermidine synthase
MPVMAPKFSRWQLWVERFNSLLIPEECPTKNVLFSLFLASVAALYAEIMLIRWISTEVRIFAYFQNLALITCFLGFGLGCYLSTHRKNVTFSLMAMTALVVLVKAPLENWKKFLSMHSSLLALSPDAVIWGGFSKDLGVLNMILSFAASIVVMAVFLALLIGIMVPLGQLVGFYLDLSGNAIRAYSVNLVGSVAGLWTLAILSFLWLPPGYWFGLSFLLILIIQPSPRVALTGLVLLGISLVFLRDAQTDKEQTHWSPYQKLQVERLGEQMYNIYTNNTGYMTISNLTPQLLGRYPKLAQAQNSYDTPFLFALNRDRVLILGAGAGNDAAAALRNGAERVDAVEIDPVIHHLGSVLHPERPYEASKVQMTIQDARAFLSQTKEQYDIILFALLDSHTQFSNLSNMRIDNYVYTEEALRKARQLLTPQGILILKFHVTAPWTWMGQRFYNMLENIFSRKPIVFFVPQLGPLLSATVFIESNDPGLWVRATSSDLATLVAKNPPFFPLQTQGGPPPTTDDWPYIYHRNRSLPHAYLIVSLILAIITVPLVRRTAAFSQISTWRFFFLGAGFLLLETQMVSRLALYFGTTWIVTSLVITAILLMLVLANFFVATQRRIHLGLYSLLLVVSLVANYLFPWEQLSLSLRTVGLLLVAGYSLPIFFAGVIFTESLRHCERKSSAFGANIVGAVAGGLAQNISFILGMKALLVIAAFFYALAALAGLLSAHQTTLAKTDHSPVTPL